MFITRCADVVTFGNVAAAMGDGADQFTVRPDFPQTLIAVSQRFAFSVHVLEARAFLDAVERLTVESPLAQSPAEAVMAWFALKDAVARGAECHHAWFHQCLDNSPCTFQYRTLSTPPAFDISAIISTLNDWAIDYTRRFDAVHCWPAAIRASALFRIDPAKLWPLDDLADAVYVSTATLERSFRRIYGVTVRQYQAQVRLRSVVAHVRASSVCIESILVEHGYRSPKDAYQLCRRVTGMTLSELRRLSEVEYRSLLEGPLAIPRAGWRAAERRLQLAHRLRLRSHEDSLHDPRPVGGDRGRPGD